MQDVSVGDRQMGSRMSEWVIGGGKGWKGARPEEGKSVPKIRHSRESRSETTGSESEQFH